MRHVIDKSSLVNVRKVDLTNIGLTIKNTSGSVIFAGQDAEQLKAIINNLSGEFEWVLECRTTQRPPDAGTGSLPE